MLTPPQWTRYWREFTTWPRKPLHCFVCDKKVIPQQVALVKDKNIYCQTCAEGLYQRIREDLAVLERRIIEVAQRLGHHLGEFKPGYYCSRESGIWVAECENCYARVCYEVVDILRDHQRASVNPIVIHEPIGFPLKHDCCQKPHD